MTPNQQQQLTTFLLRSLPGAPYTQRAKIALLTAQGVPAGQIAIEIKLSLQQVLTFQRAFEQQGLTLFPATIFRDEIAHFKGDDPITTAGRIFLAYQLQKMSQQEAAIVEQAEATAIHETRKAVRRMRTILRLLRPYYDREQINLFRQQLQQSMQQVGYARDVAVFLGKLSQWLTQADLGAEMAAHFVALQTYWQNQLTQADQQAQAAITSPEHQNLCRQLANFCQESGSVPAGTFPYRVRDLAASLIYAKLADVRLFDPYLEQASLAEMHELRIRFKELRYTIEFFAPLMGNKIVPLLADLDQIQDHLGNLNDARIALELLAQTPNNEPVVTYYQAAQTAELQNLVATFPNLWAQFNSLTWRQNLAQALLVL